MDESACILRGTAARAVLVLSVVLCLAFLAPENSWADNGTNWWDSAATESRDEFMAVKDSVGQTIEKLDQARERLGDIENWARSNLQGAELQAVLDKVGKAGGALDTYSEPLRIFDQRMGKVSSAVDVLFDLKELADAAGQRRGGDLAASLHILATAMERYGEKVPIIGAAIQAYGEVTKGILDATDQIAQTIEEQRNQGMFGAGTYGGVDSPLYLALEAQFGADFTGSHTFAPGQVPYLYESVQDNTFAMIWDPDSQTWYRVEQSLASVQEIYRNYVLAKGHPSPWELNVLATTSYDAYTGRLNAGREAIALWRAWNAGWGNIAFDAVNTQNDYQLRTLLGDPQSFAARYALDQQFHRQINQWMADLYREALQLEAEGADAMTAAAIRAWAQRYGIPLPGDPATGTQPGAQPGISASVVILFDASGSMADDGKIDAAKAAARNVLTQLGSDTEVALIVFYDCGSIQVEQEFTTDAGLVLNKVEAISPSGSTPLAAGIAFAKEYIARNAANDTARLVILSDGEETCGGDPVSAAQQ